MTSKGFDEIFGLNSLAFEGLEHRARMPLMLRDMVNRGCVEVTLSMSAKTALNMARDIEFAVQSHPHGVPKEPVLSESNKTVALSDHQIALRLMAIREGEEVDGLIEKWDDAVFATWAKAQHIEDCAGKSEGCPRCLYERYMDEAANARRMFNIPAPEERDDQGGQE